MTDVSLPDLNQFDALAQVDDLTERTRQWCEQTSPWQPIGRVRALLRRVLERVATLRIRMESPLVVATFGGTGTGKSTLVNALVGDDVTKSGRQRPTTRKPILILHVSMEAETLGLPLSQFEIVRSSADILRELVVVDCPDPDTSETAAAGENLALLRAIVPLCDVLIFTATQEKYRSARVLDELADAAGGCRLLFVQTHADVDSDIRDDWQTVLSGYEVPEMFFLDSRAAREAQKAGRPVDLEFARLREVLREELAASERVRVRRANVLDLLAAATEHGSGILEQSRPHVVTLRQKLAGERESMARELATNLQTELLSSRHLWERRLITAVTENWGFSPFSSVLRLYNGLGGFIASMSLSRARTVAQVALIGVAEGGRRLREWQAERNSDDRVSRLDAIALDDGRLREARMVISGYADSAQLVAALPNDADLDSLRVTAAEIEQRFLGSVAQNVENIIQEVAASNSRWYVRFLYECLLGGYLAFIVYRIAKNFFYESFFRTTFDAAAVTAPLLPMEFYVAAGVFLALWSGILVILFTRRLRRGLDRRVRKLANDLAGKRLTGGLFPQLEAAAQLAERQCDELIRLSAETRTVRSEIVEKGRLGGRRAVAPAVSSATPLAVTK